MLMQENFDMHVNSTHIQTKLFAMCMGMSYESKVKLKKSTSPDHNPYPKRTV